MLAGWVIWLMWDDVSMKMFAVAQTWYGWNSNCQTGNKGGKQSNDPPKLRTLPSSVVQKLAPHSSPIWFTSSFPMDCAQSPSIDLPTICQDTSSVRPVSEVFALIARNLSVALPPWCPQTVTNWERFEWGKPLCSRTHFRSEGVQSCNLCFVLMF